MVTAFVFFGSFVGFVAAFSLLYWRIRRDEEGW